MEKQVACAAAISSSGLVFPPGSSKRDANVTSWFSTEWLLSRSKCPEPLFNSPSHVACARRSIAIFCLLIPGSRGSVVLAAPQIFRDMVHFKPGRVGMRIDVALAPPELLRALVMSVA